MSTMYYEIEVAHRREELLRTRRGVGLSRRERRRRARLAEGTAPEAGSSPLLRPVPRPRLG